MAVQSKVYSGILTSKLVVYHTADSASALLFGKDREEESNNGEDDCTAQRPGNPF